MISTAEQDPGVDTGLPEGELIAAGTVIAERYRVLSMIGCGGMGSVYLAENLRAGGTVAIKVLRFEWSRNPALARRFRNEAKLANYAEHPNIVKVLDCSELPDGRFYLVMEFVTGTTLAAELADHGAMSVGRACRIARAIACAISASHANDVVHRDLKTENVMLTRYEGDDAEFVKVVDFGVSALLQDSDAAARLTRPGQSVGTPEYMAPEQAMGKPPSVAFDIYALGVLVFEMLTGEPPFCGGGAIEIMARKAMEAAPSLIGRRDDIPLQLAFLVDDCLQRDPTKRPASATEFLRRIDEILRTVGREEAAGYGRRKPPAAESGYSLHANAVPRPPRVPSPPKSLSAVRPSPRLDLRPIARDDGRRMTPDHVTPNSSSSTRGKIAEPPAIGTPPGRPDTIPEIDSSELSMLNGDGDGVIQQRRHRGRVPPHRPSVASLPTFGEHAEPRTEPALDPDNAQSATRREQVEAAPVRRDTPSRSSGSMRASKPPTPRPANYVEAIEVEYEREPSGARVSASLDDQPRQRRGLLAPRPPAYARHDGSWGLASPQSFDDYPKVSVRQATDSEAYPASSANRRRRHVITQAITLSLAAVGVVALVWLVAGQPQIRGDAQHLGSPNAQTLAAQASARQAGAVTPSSVTPTEPSLHGVVGASGRAAVPPATHTATPAVLGDEPADHPSAVTPKKPSQVAATDETQTHVDTDERAARSRSSDRQTKARKRSRQTNTAACVEAREQAEAAHVAHRWAEVLTHTRSANCWARRSERAALRTQALFQLGRFDECVRAGRGATEAATAKFVRLCRLRSEQDER